MPWADDPSKTINHDLYVSLFPLTEKELRVTVAKCDRPLTLFRTCTSSQSPMLEDWEVTQRCEKVLEDLRACSERVLAEAKKKKSVGALGEERFMMKGDFSGGV
ncbi:hypothetical protein [Phaffia rhodozyma]|uniref:Uncharacterized protein n=1 Tax=Phaffia rhodozyma TaxID=264483 RepID=A0A0F7SJ09_PHARH|nr:hypothetical protein [Phaffia rhodozyma]